MIFSVIGYGQQVPKVKYVYNPFTNKLDAVVDTTGFYAAMTGPTGATGATGAIGATGATGGMDTATVTLTDNTPTNLYNASLGTDSIYGAEIGYSVMVTDNDSTQLEQGIFHIGCVYTSTVFSSSFVSTNTQITPKGTLTPTLSMAYNVTTNVVTITVSYNTTVAGNSGMKIKYTKLHKTD